MYNIIGGVLWVSLFLFAGYFLGSIEFVKTNFHYVAIGIIVLSIVPLVFEIFNHKKNNKEESLTKINSQYELEDLIQDDKA